MIIKNWFTFPTPIARSIAVLSVLLAFSLNSDIRVHSTELPIAQTPAFPADEQPQPYRLGSGDLISIRLFDLPNFSGDYRIPVGGILNLPLIGSVVLQGLTLEEAEVILREKYLEVIKDPIVTVILITPRPLTVSVTGEVAQPGSYDLDLGQAGEGREVANQFPTVTQAIEQAGGVTLAADITQVEIRRWERGGLRQSFQVNLQDFLQNGRQAQNIRLRDGDTIFIPTAASVDLDRVRRLGTAKFALEAERPRTVAVVGQVKNPGVYVLVGGDTTSNLTTQGLPTVSRALQLAGGITPEADIRQVYIRRLTHSGNEQVIPVNLWQLLQAGDFNQNTLVQSGDTIVVPHTSEVNPAEATQLAHASFSPETIQVVVVGEINNRPGTIQGVLELPSNTTLNQALLAAGGFSGSRANRESVQLIRIQPDGTALQRRIKVDFSQGMNDRTNPMLRDNDTIVVDRSLPAEVSDLLRTSIQFAPEAAALIRMLEILGVVGD